MRIVMFGEAISAAWRAVRPYCGPFGVLAWALLAAMAVAAIHKATTFAQSGR